MLKGYWLVADLDGTLCPTPSKAGGKYYSLSQSTAVFGSTYRSCLPHLSRFIALGGSLCVASTAGKRMMRQVYADLAPFLFPLLVEPHLVGNEAREEKEEREVRRAAGKAPGRLLLCGFTGAALFRSRDPSVVLREWAALRSSHSADERVSAAVGIEEWVEYREKASAVGNAAAFAESGGDRGTTTMQNGGAAHTAATIEGRAAIVRFFEHAAFVSDYDPEKAFHFFKGCLSTKYHKTYAEMLEKVLAEVRAKNVGRLPCQGSATAASCVASSTPLCFDDISLFDMGKLAQEGFFLPETQDTLVDSQGIPCADGTVRSDGPIAQVVVLGIPMRHFPIIFPFNGSSATAVTSAFSSSSCEDEGGEEKTEVVVAVGGDGDDAPSQLRCCSSCAAKAVGALERLSALGLVTMPQPNSVCIHQRGIDKGTCMRWLSAHSAELDFSLDRALAFGDVPSSVDKPLTLFPPMRFISLSPHEPSTEDMPAATPPPGPNTYHVGGEEEGTALFLEELLNECERAASGETESENVIRSENLFSEARVTACAARARARARQL